MMRIEKFEEKLNPEQEIGLRVAQFGMDNPLYIEDISYHGPDLIFLYCTNRHGDSVELIQHYSQVSIALISLQKRHEVARRIGFRQS